MVASRAIVLEVSPDYRRMAPTLVVWIEAIIIALVTSHFDTNVFDTSRFAKSLFIPDVK